jgi:hypothetical protein
MRKWANISLYMRRPLVIYVLQLLHFEFPYIWGKFYFLFYQCGAWAAIRIWTRTQVCCIDIHKCCPDGGRYQSIKQLEHFSTEEVFCVCFFRSIRIPGGPLIYTLFKWLSVHFQAVWTFFYWGGSWNVFWDFSVTLFTHCLNDWTCTVQNYRTYI